MFSPTIKLVHALKPFFFSLVYAIPASKFSIRAFANIYEGMEESMLEPIFASVKESLKHDNPNLETLICALGHLTLACPEKFGPDMKTIVAKFIVKEILMQDR